MKDYVTIEQAAELEGVTYNQVQKRIARGHYKTMMIAPEGGGKERVMIAVSSLSHKARRVRREQLKEQVKMDNDDPPWYVYADYEWYMKKYKKSFFEGVEIAQAVKQYLDYNGSRTDYIEECARRLGVSVRSFYVFVQLYTEAEAWVTKIEASAGENYEYIKVLAVCRKPREEANPFPSIPKEMQEWIEIKLYSPIFARNLQPISNLYDDLTLEAPDHGWTEIPSYHTVLRYVKHIKTQDGKGAMALAARGLRYWKNKYMMKKYRNTEKLQVLEVVQGDVHTFDTWVRVKRPNGKWQAIRPCLVAWLDTRSRCIIGWAIGEDPDAQTVKRSLINSIYPKKNPELPYGVGRFLLIDNGKEYTAESLTGRPRTVRFELDAELKGFYKSIGIEDDMRCLPYQPWGKAQMERFFGTVCGKFSKRFPAYTGTLTGSRTDGKVQKQIKDMLEKGELPTLEEFEQQWEDFVVKIYHKRKHSGLMIQGEDVPAPISVWHTAERYMKAAPPIEYAMSLLAQVYDRQVTQMGIRVTINGKPIFYANNDELHRYIGERVQFRYYPDDITKIVCYTMDGRRICEAVSYELLTIAPKLREAEFVEHNKDQKRQQRDDKNTIIKRQMTREQRLAAEQVMREEAGKKMVGPELDTGAQPVVALPEDRQYRDERKADSRMRNSKRPVTNAYFDSQAEAAIADIERLRKLG